MMLSNEQRKLWRQTAWVGIVTAGLVVLTLLGDLAFFGLNQAYFQLAYFGAAEPIVTPHSYLDFAGITLLGLIIFLPRLFLGIVFSIFLRSALISHTQTLLQEIFRLGVTGAMAALTWLGAMEFMLLFYTQTEDRYLMPMGIKVGNMLYSWMIQLSFAAILYAVWQNRRLPRSIVAFSMAILGLAFIYSLFGTHPNVTQFFSTLIAFGAAVILALYMLWATYQDDQHKTPTTRFE